MNRPSATANRATWLLAVAVIAGMFGYGASPPHDQLVGILWFGLVWTLGLVWAILNRVAILGPHPDRALWLVLIAIFALNRPNLRPPASTVIGWVSLLGAVLAGGFAILRTPRRSAHGLLLVIAMLLWFFGGIMLLGVVLSQCGIQGGSYGVFSLELPTGGINDAIAAAIGAVFGIAGWAAMAGARRLKRHSRSQS